MFSVIHAVIERFKALFLVRAVLELEADLIALGADRQAELLRRADQYEKEGLNGVAQRIRQQAESLSIEMPLASVQAVIAHLQDEAPDSSKIVGAPPPQRIEAAASPRKKKP